MKNVASRKSTFAISAGVGAVFLWVVFFALRDAPGNAADAPAAPVAMAGAEGVKMVGNPDRP